MTLNDLQRAALVLYAAREVGREGSLEQMKAVCYVIRNRVTAGWDGANWLTVIEAAAKFAGNLNGKIEALDINDRRLQLLARDVDEIFYGQADDDVSRMCGRQNKEHGPLFYWTFINRPPNPWFAKHIGSQPIEHFQRGSIGLMYLYE